MHMRRGAQRNLLILATFAVLGALVGTLLNRVIFGEWAWGTGALFAVTCTTGAWLAAKRRG